MPKPHATPKCNSRCLAGRRQLALGDVIFEVTEGERVEDGPWFAEILTEYRRQGLLIAIDDFGAGYAGLRLLSDFQPDLIAEGIETAGERDFFVHEGVRLFQGVLFSRPLFGRLADTPGGRG